MAAPGTSTAKVALRRLGAGASLGASAAAFAVMAARETDFASARWGLLAMATVTAVAAAGFLRRSIASQVLARGVAWAILAPTLVAILGSLVEGRTPEAGTAAFAAAAAAALLLARPAIHTDEARREFAPVDYRRWFLVGSVASVMVAVVAGFASVEALMWSSTRGGLGLAALATALLGSAFGVLRMRAWGVLLGGATSLTMLGATALAGSELEAVAMGLAALPGMLLVAPLAVERLRAARAVARKPVAGVARVLDADLEMEGVSPQVRTRVAALEVDEAVDDASIAARARLAGKA